MLCVVRTSIFPQLRLFAAELFFQADIHLHSVRFYMEEYKKEVAVPMQ